MHLHWERSPNVAGDCNIRSLSWMGRVPDEIPQEEGWKLNRNHYYQEGWLSTANLRGVVGVTYTTSHCGGSGFLEPSCEKYLNLEPPNRTNYNLRGHRAEVTLVRWNEPYQKLASCDTSGIIFVWIKYEGRWSIELINDRNTPVICFAWSHDGRMALICYQDGFVLVGSVAGQRFWSTLLPPDINSITSGVWTPDDQYVYLGTSQGGLLVMDIQGNTVARVNLRDGVPITELSWNCERFNMEEQSDRSHSDNQQQQPYAYQNQANFRPSEYGASPLYTSSSNRKFTDQENNKNERNPSQPSAVPNYKPDGKPYILAVCFKNGEILLIRTYDDIIPQTICTGLHNFYVDWTNSGELLAVAGKVREIANKADHTIRYINVIHFYDENGQLLYRSKIPSEMHPVTSITWGHNDKRIFVATGNHIHVGWVSPNIASLQLLSRLKIHKTLQYKDQVDTLPLPCRLQDLIAMLFTQTIRCYIPNASDLRQFVIKPQPDSVRVHCTMIKHGESFADELASIQPGHPLASSSLASGSNTSSSNHFQTTASSSYTLYMEHLGGFLPLLKGKKVCKIRPEFVIFDPQLTGEEEMSNWYNLPLTTHNLSKRLHTNNMTNDLSETDTDDEMFSPRVRRRRRQRRNRRGPVPRYGFLGGSDSIDYANILPEESRLAEVSSNFWGTKFKIIGLDLKHLPPNLGQINYKASLLHLQPRQMRLEITDLKDDSGSGKSGRKDRSYKDIDEWNYLDDSSDDGWVEENDDFTAEVEKKEKERIDSLQDLIEENDSPKKGVTMKDDILTAVKEDPIPTNVAPIAPLPSRLSFCFSPKHTSNQGTPTNSNILDSPNFIYQSPGKVSKPPDSCLNQTTITSDIVLPNVPKKEMLLLSPENKKYSPTKLQNFMCEGTCSGGGALSTLAAVKRSPTVAPSIAGRMIAKGNAIEIDSIDSEIVNISSHVHDSIAGVKIESPSKRCLRISISCDNYLGDGKSVIPLSNRGINKKEEEYSDSNNSPYNSCKGSPLRWAAKADEVMAGSSGSNTMTSSLIANATVNNVLNANEEQKEFMSSSVTSPRMQLQKMASPQRSCSDNHLDLIVDILGVPSELLTQRDLNRRLFLLEEGKGDKKNKKTNVRQNTKYQRNTIVTNKHISTSQNPKLRKCGKSKSCEEDASSVTTPVPSRRKKRAEVEAKRRSVYLKECSGRSDALKACDKCVDTAYKVHDLESNKEMFHVPTSSDSIVLKDHENDSDVCSTADELGKGDENLIECQPNDAKLISVNSTKESRSKLNLMEEPNDIKVVPITEEDSGETIDYFKTEDNEKLIQIKSPKNANSRKFDAVKNLLEKARKKLLKLTGPQKNFRKMEKNANKESEKSKDNANEAISTTTNSNNKTILSMSYQHQNNLTNNPGTQSSPATPAEIRKKGPKIRNRSFSPVRALLNSPLIRRKKKSSSSGDSNNECSSSIQRQKLEGKKNHNLKNSHNNRSHQREDNCSFNLLMDDFDSDSDEDIDDPKDHRAFKTSQSGRDEESTYHNLETFQKKQLKQKIKQFSNQSQYNPTPPSSLPMAHKSSKDISTSNKAEVVISSPMTPLCRPYPSPPPAPNRRPSRPAPKSTLNVNSIEESLFKNELNASSVLQCEENSPHLPRKFNDPSSNKSSPLLPIKSSSNKHQNNLSFGKRFLPKTPNSTPFSTPFTKRKNQQMFHQYNQVHNAGSEASIGEQTRRRLVLHNKSPMWNEASQVYQLDFGGRVTQESAKNFQIEYKGKQVMQFGRIDNNAYTLDFQYPFTAVQAFAVALANVTQRLK